MSRTRFTNRRHILPQSSSDDVLAGVISGLELLETASDVISCIPCLGIIVSAVIGMVKAIEVSPDHGTIELILESDDRLEYEGHKGGVCGARQACRRSRTAHREAHRARLVRREQRAQSEPQRPLQVLLLPSNVFIIFAHDLILGSFVKSSMM